VQGVYNLPHVVDISSVRRGYPRDEEDGPNVREAVAGSGGRIGGEAVGFRLRVALDDHLVVHCEYRQGVGMPPRPSQRWAMASFSMSAAVPCTGAFNLSVNLGLSPRSGSTTLRRPSMVWVSKFPFSHSSASQQNWCSPSPFSFPTPS
jgi:hypothetical protein